jgi:hypothetical protein
VRFQCLDMNGHSYILSRFYPVSFFSQGVCSILMLQLFNYLLPFLDFLALVSIIPSASFLTRESEILTRWLAKIAME